MPNHLPSASTREQNRGLQEQERDQAVLTLSSRPRRVWFALTGRCNLACIHCPRIAGVSSDVDMEGDVLQRFKTEVLPLAEEVDFGGNNLGEQMIHAEFLSALTDIRDAGCEVQVTTNGTRLNEQNVVELAKRGVRLRISLEGIRETYHQIRGVPWEKLLEGLRAYQQAMHEHAEARPALEFGMTVFANNLDELPELVRIAKEIGARRIFVQHLIPKEESQRLQSLMFHRSSANKVFDETRRLADELGIDVRLPEPLACGEMSRRKATPTPETTTAASEAEPALQPCYLPWTSVNILENGDILPCCVAGGELIMGNLKKSSFEDIWNGPAYRRLRKSVNSSNPHPTCKTCSMRGGGAAASYENRLSGSGQRIFDRLKTTIKDYLLRSGRKKTLAKLVKIRDAVNRALSRI